MKHQTKITVRIVEPQTKLTGGLNGSFRGDKLGPLSGQFSARATRGMVMFFDQTHREIIRFPSIRLIPTFLAGQIHRAHVLAACL